MKILHRLHKADKNILHNIFGGTAVIQEIAR